MTDLSLENVDFVDEEFDNDKHEKFVNERFGVCGSNMLVGHGVVTSELCGRYEGDVGCLNVEGHRFALQLAGSGDEPKIYRRPVFIIVISLRVLSVFVLGWFLRVSVLIIV